MARELHMSSTRDIVSNLTRRDYLRATSAVAGGLGLGLLGSRSATAATTPTVDVAAPTTTHTWTTVSLSTSYADPVVIAPTLSYNGRQPASPRVRNVTGSSFDLSVEEWLYLDGAHLTETIGTLVTDAGTYTLPDGRPMEVGRVQTNHNWASTTFSASFSATPLVFSTTQTVNGRQPVVTRHQNRSATGVGIRLQEEEAKGAHRTESIGYLALEPGAGMLDGHQFEAAATGVSDDWQTISFTNSYDQPVFLADLQTTNGRNTSDVRYRNLTSSSVDVKVEEEQSGDSETAHLTEQVGYLIVDAATTQSASETTTTTTAEDVPLSELDRTRVEQRIHKHINDRRANHGLAALAFDTDLQEIARYHSKDMATRDYFSHTDPEGNNFADRYDKFGYTCRAETSDGRYYTGGENIAYTYYQTPVNTDSGTETYTNADELAQGIVRGWMNSQGHRENILTKAWDNEGIGVYITDSGKVYATQNFC